MRTPLRLLPILLCSLALPGFVWADEPAKKPSRVDAQGDALPEGALARLGTIRFRDGNYFNGSALSPDGKVLALSNNSGTMRLLDVATGKEKRSFRTNGGGSSWLTFSPDGKLLAASNYGGRIQLWDVATGNATQQLGPPGQSRIAHLFTFSGDSKYIAVGSESYGQGKPAAYVWDVGSGKLVAEVEPIHNNNVHVALSNDGKILATTGMFYDRMGGGGPAQFEKNKIIQLWDVSKGKELKKLLSEDAYTMNLAFSPDGKHLATIGSNSALAIWDVAAAKVVRRFATRRGTGSFLGYSPDGKILAATTNTNTVQLWDASTGKRLGLFEGPSGVVARVGFAPGGKVLAWGGAGQAVGLWDVRAEKSLTPTAGHTSSVSAVAFLGGGKELLSVSMDGTVCFWDAAGKETHRLRLRDDESRRFGGYRSHQAVIVSPDGKHLLTGDFSSLCLWELAKGREVCSFAGHNSRGAAVAAFSPDGQQLAVVTTDPQARATSVRLYEVNSAQEVRQLRGMEGEVSAVVFSQDGQKLVDLEHAPQVGAVGASAWDATTGKRLWQAKRDGNWLQAVAFSPDGRAVAVADQSGAVVLLDAAGGRELRRLVSNVNAGTVRLAFAPDSRTLAVGGYRGDTRTGSLVLWEVASGTVRRESSGHEGMLTSLAFSPDGRQIATGSWDTTVLLWDLDTSAAQAVKKLTAKELDEAWSALEAADGKTAYAAMGKLMAAPADALVLLQKQLKPTRGKMIDDETVTRWVSDLDHRRFERREQAMRNLESAGKRAEKALRKALEGKPSAEMRRRVQQLLDKLEVQAPTQETLRPTRALEVLERLGTPEAKQLLESLAGGAPGTWLTDEAKVSLQRLSARARSAP